jgi:hypothetical protein
VNTELLSDAHTAARNTQALIAATAATVTIAAADHQHLSVSPRRFVAGTLMLAGLGMTRMAARMLPAGSPTRVFIMGMVDGVPVHWRDLPSFARRRVTPSADELTP